MRCPSALPGPHLPSAWLSLGIPSQGWELKGEATWKEDVENNCGLLCSRGGGETLGPLCRVGSREALLAALHKGGILLPAGQCAPLSCWPWVCPDPAAPCRHSAEAAQALCGPFHILPP